MRRREARATGALGRGRGCRSALCTPPSVYLPAWWQGFNGLLDEVRIWRVARRQEDILKTMRCESALTAPRP